MPVSPHNDPAAPPHAIGRREFAARALAAGAGLALPGVLGRCGGPGSTSADAGPARTEQSAGELTLGNDAVSAAWSVSDGRLRALRFEDGRAGATLALPADVFSLRLEDGAIIRASELRLVGQPELSSIAADPAASRFSEREPGRAISVRLEHEGSRLGVTWRAVMRDGSSYIRQELSFSPADAELPVREIVLIDAPVPAAAVAGTVDGSPVVAGNVYLGFEHPLSRSSVVRGRVRCSLRRELPLRPGTTFAVSSVIGAVPAGQLRRGFLSYVERERAHPYRPFLHYNSWYDIGYFSKYDEAAALDVIHAFGRELHEQRDVTLDSFLFDDGWDDPKTLWHFNAGFPHGFTPLRRAAARYDAAPGVWLSPWGGYGEPRQQRLAYGRAQGFETNDGGFLLSGPKYYDRFRDTCLDMIRTYGVNQFKIDGTGNADRAFPGSVFDSDFDAAINLIGELRAAKPDLYINLTTGTYPSPFWLRYADSIWRGGSDHDFAGVGSQRQQWITYRDADTYRGIVGRGPLFPLSSLMLHGLIYARQARGLDTDPGGDFTDEIHSYFGTGTQLQEMYVTHELLSRENWDTLAEAARWSRGNAATLEDTHWVGGDPQWLEAYGWAAWSPGKGILTLRNPGERAQTIDLDIGDVFELPAGATDRYTARSPWGDERDRKAIELRAGEAHRFALRPFEVLTLEAVAAPV